MVMILMMTVMAMMTGMNLDGLLVLNMKLDGFDFGGWQDNEYNIMNISLRKMPLSNIFLERVDEINKQILN